MKLNNLFQRTLSGIVYLAIIIGSLFLGEYAFGALFLAISLLAIAEYFNISGYSDFDDVSITGILSGALTFLLIFLCASGVIRYIYLGILMLVPVIFMIAGLFMRTDPVKKIATLFTGFFYVSVPIALTNILVFPAENYGLFTHRIFLGLLTLIWINDTGAYVTGMLLGRNRMFPRISPKKSWEGFAGGTVFTIATGFFMAKLMGILDQTDWIVMSVIVSLLGVLGDLAESLVKRNAKVKDSGSLIPGHGGVLDRFDSMLLVIPVTVVYLLLS